MVEKLLQQVLQNEIMRNKKSVTGAYLSGRMQIPVPDVRKEPKGWLKVIGAAENNLKNIDVSFPVRCNDVRDWSFWFRKKFFSK